MAAIEHRIGVPLAAFIAGPQLALGIAIAAAGAALAVAQLV